MTAKWTALARLREAWMEADEAERPSVEASIRALLSGPSMEKHEDFAMRVLTAGLDHVHARKLCAACGIETSYRRRADV